MAKKVKPELVEEPVPQALSPGKSILWIGIFIIFVVLVLFGPLAYKQWHNKTVAKENQYNGFDFVKTQSGDQELWVTRLEIRGQPYNIPFYHHPAAAESVGMQPGLTDRFLYSEQKPKEIYLTLSPDAGSIPVIAAVEISRLTGYKYGLLNIDTRSALQEQILTADYPIITCADATNETAVLFFQEGAFNTIVADEQYPYCIRFVYTSANESTLVADRFAYGLLRIMGG